MYGNFKKLSLDAFSLKMIAIVSMGVQHTVMILWEIFPIWVHIPLCVLRGITFPIMAFFVVEGFKRTSNIKKYMGRLFLFGLIAQIPHNLAFGFFTLNIIFTIFLGLVCLMMYDSLYVKKQKRGLFIALFILILLVSNITEGAMFGLILIFLFHVVKNEKKRRTLPLIYWGCFTIILSFFFRTLATVFPIDMADMSRAMQLETILMQYYVFPIGSFVIIPLLRAYNGERGKRAKYLFYAFYPLHFVILAVIAHLLGLNYLNLGLF